MSKYTDEDVKQLAAIMRTAKDGRPFALLTGAGCSKSAGIPLASKLVDEILANESLAPHLGSLPDDRRRDYGALMSRLSKNERKELLGKYLDDAKINWAHIALASMMHAGIVDRVLTFNFDNLLARACGICGRYPATYDFVTGVSQSTDHIVSPSIIHLHGQGYGLSMLNSEEETQDHAEKLRGLFRDTLKAHPLLVIGYSGDSDRVFPVLLDEFKGNERVYWVGYADDPNQAYCDLEQKNPTLVRYFGGADADRFLIDLAQELGCWPPSLFSDPVAHLRSEIEPIADFPFAGSDVPGIDVLATLKAKLDGYSQHGPADGADFGLMLKFLQGDIDAIIDAHEAGTDVPDNLLFSAAMSKGVEATKSWRQIDDKALLNEAAQWFEQAVAINPERHEALYNWGLTLADKAEVTGDAALFDQAGEKFQQALAIKPDKYQALNYWGVALADKAEVTGDASLLDQAGEKFEQALAIKPDDHEALNNWGVALMKKAGATGEAALFDRAIEKYKQALDIKPDDFEVLFNWGLAFSHKADATGDAALFDQAIEKFQQALDIKPNNYRALHNWGVALMDKAKVTGEAALFDQAAEKYEQALKLKPDEAYNAACLAALRGESRVARGHLEICAKAGTLPTRIHLEADTDLDSLRDEAWFHDILDEAK